MKLCLMKYGVGKWVQILETGLLPGKLIQQLNGQAQRLLGQQSLAGVMPPIAVYSRQHVEGYSLSGQQRVPLVCLPAWHIMSNKAEVCRQPICRSG